MSQNGTTIYNYYGLGALSTSANFILMKYYQEILFNFKGNDHDCQSLEQSIQRKLNLWQEEKIKFAMLTQQNLFIKILVVETIWNFIEIARTSI